MSERAATIKEKWVACAILWVALVLVFAVSWWVYGMRDDANPLDGFFRMAIFFVPIAAGLSFLTESWELRRRASLPRGFRHRRYWPGARSVGWWVPNLLAVVWSIGGMLWVPDNRFISVGAVLLLLQLGSELGQIAFLSTHDEQG
jgi:hypothetical protein